MDREVVQDEVVEVLEHGAHDPGVIPVHREYRAGKLTEQSSVDSVTEVGEMWSPATVLVHCQPHTLPVGKFDQPLSEVKVEHFAGSKHVRETVKQSQLRWLETANSVGVPVSSSLIVECGYE
ncbi:MAG: hypothetical protein M3281_03955 [Chloroflexota bacterium]|nr:hypothetical protein [Chloroflexota bacterium]